MKCEVAKGETQIFLTLTEKEFNIITTMAYNMAPIRVQKAATIKEFKTFWENLAVIIEDNGLAFPKGWDI